MTTPVVVADAVPPKAAQEQLNNQLFESVDSKFKTLYGKARNQDAEECKDWKDEIEKLLIVAGLFSAVVTSFLVEAYQLLQDRTDPNTRLLERILDRLPGVPAEDPTTSLPPKPFQPTSASIRVNVLWFLSLTISLGAVLVGLLCLQWLRAHDRELTATSFEDALAIRQMRYESIRKWRVPGIVKILPILIQISVVLFFAGLFDFLRPICFKVAVAALVPMSIAVVFLLYTTIRPALDVISIHHHCIWHLAQGITDIGKDNITEIFGLMTTPVFPVQCAYRSPQAWFVLKFMGKVWPHLSSLYIWGFSLYIATKSRTVRHKWTTRQITSQAALLFVTKLKDVNRIAIQDSWIHRDQAIRKYGRGFLALRDVHLESAWSTYRQTLCQERKTFLDLYGFLFTIPRGSWASIIRDMQRERILEVDGLRGMTKENGWEVEDGITEEEARLYVLLWGWKHTTFVRSHDKEFKDLVRYWLRVCQKNRQLANSETNAIWWKLLAEGLPNDIELIKLFMVPCVDVAAVAPLGDPYLVKAAWLTLVKANIYDKSSNEQQENDQRDLWIKLEWIENRLLSGQSSPRAVHEFICGQVLFIDSVLNAHERPRFCNAVSRWMIKLNGRAANRSGNVWFGIIRSFIGQDGFKRLTDWCHEHEVQASVFPPVQITDGVASGVPLDVTMTQSDALSLLTVFEKMRDYFFSDQARVLMDAEFWQLMGMGLTGSNEAWFNDPEKFMRDGGLDLSRVFDFVKAATGFKSRGPWGPRDVLRLYAHGINGLLKLQGSDETIESWFGCQFVDQRQETNDSPMVKPDTQEIIKHIRFIMHPIDTEEVRAMVAQSEVQSQVEASHILDRPPDEKEITDTVPGALLEKLALSLVQPGDAGGSGSHSLPDV